jgi:hypothetical protein
MGEGTLAPELERVTRLSLQKLEQILRTPTNRSDGNLLRAQTAAATAALNAQLRADETRLREQRSNDVLARLVEAIRQERRRASKRRRRGRLAREGPCRHTHSIAKSMGVGDFATCRR